MTADTTAHAPPVEPGLVSRALEVAGRLANDAAEVITATAGRERRVRPAYPYDWVTDTDRTLERHTRRVLAAEFPDTPLGGPTGNAAFHWLVAPVDGVANYAAGLPWCAYSLALLDGYGPVVGVLADPSRAHIYAAARGRGVRANGVPVRVSGRTGGGLVCAELRAASAGPFADAVAGRTGIRVLGSAALAVAQVALGHADAAVVDGHEPRDVAAAVCLAREAGALVVEEAGGLVVSVPDTLDPVSQWWRAAQDRCTGTTA